MNIRIGIDFHVVDGIFQGSRRHVLELFSRVIALSPDMEFYLFLDRPEVLRSHSPVFCRPHVHLVRMPHANPIIRLCWQLPFLQKKYALSYLHTQYIIPMPSLSPCFVTIHDILFEKYPQFFSFPFRLRSKIMIRLAARRAIHIFTVSEYSKREIVECYGIDHDKITVIQNGVDLRKYRPGQTQQEVIHKRGLTSGNYILSVGRLEPRKNYPTLIQAYLKMPAQSWPLVIIGQRHFGAKAIFKLVNTLGAARKVTILEDVSDDELPALYRHAGLFVYPTYAEGFGLPLAEAMASGLPIISSNSTSIPDVIGNAGILVDSSNVLELAQAMNDITRNNELRQKLKKEALSRAASLQWDLSAKRVREIYKRLL